MTFLFDIGNVLLAFDFLPALNSLKGDKSHSEVFEKILQAKDDFESGKLSTAQYLPMIRKWLDFSGSDNEIISAWNSVFTEITQTFQLAEHLRDQGHRLILFSNINPIHARFCTEKYRLLEKFDRAVFSFEIGAIKPEDAFFTRAFDTFSIIPENTIYIDDLPKNVEVGKRHGLNAFCYDFHKHHELLDWLKQQNID